MSRTEGRAEKRVRMSVPIELSKLKSPNSAERTVTENVCSFGVRVFARRPMEPNEQLMVSSSNLRTKARVVYCHKVSRDSFAIGLEFREVRVNWFRCTEISA